MSHYCIHSSRQVPSRTGFDRIKTAVAFVCIAAGIMLTTWACADPNENSGLAYDELTLGPVPIPSSERALQTVVAEPWFEVSDEDIVLEGAIFDGDGNLLFCDVSGRRVLRLSSDKRLSTVIALEDFSPGGLAFHKDGRLFIAAMDQEKGRGTVVAVNPNGSRLQTILAADAGYMPNDLVFDAQGGFYFTDFKGTATEPEGGVYYIAPDLKTISPVLPHLAKANGVALSPDGRFLWATEFGRNLLHRIELTDPVTISAIGSAVPYRFIGPAPDSMRTDVDGNVYVAIYGQGRVLAFNRNGIPIGQILLPGRDRGAHLRSTSLAISPESTDLLIVTSDGEIDRGATIFRSKSFAPGLRPASSP